MTKGDVYKEHMLPRTAGKLLNHRQRYATNDELDWLTSYAALLPDGAQVIVLGAGPGVMLAALKDGNSSLSIFVVDHDTCDYALAHLGSFGPEYVHEVFGFVGDSAAVGTTYEGRRADLLIVDADHTERGVFNDLVSWLAHVEVGGVIMCHDYDATGTWFAEQEQYPGVKAACDQIFRQYERPSISQVGTSALYVNRVLYDG